MDQRMRGEGEEVYHNWIESKYQKSLFHREPPTWQPPTKKGKVKVLLLQCATRSTAYHTVWIHLYNNTVQQIGPLEDDIAKQVSNLLVLIHKWHLHQTVVFDVIRAHIEDDVLLNMIPGIVNGLPLFSALPCGSFFQASEGPSRTYFGFDCWRGADAHWHATIGRDMMREESLVNIGRGLTVRASSGFSS